MDHGHRPNVVSEPALPDLLHELVTRPVGQQPIGLAQRVAGCTSFGLCLIGCAGLAPVGPGEERCAEAQAERHRDVAIFAGLVQTRLNPLVGDFVEFVVPIKDLLCTVPGETQVFYKCVFCSLISYVRAKVGPLLSCLLDLYLVLMELICATLNSVGEHSSTELSCPLIFNAIFSGPLYFLAM